MPLPPSGEGFVYIAGPYRPRSGTHDVSVYDEIHANIMRARDAAHFLADYDIPFFCPHLNSTHFEITAPDVPPEFWLRMDMTILIHAKAVWLVSGWEESTGALTEVEAASRMDIPVYLPDAGLLLVTDWRARLGALEGTINAIRAKE